MATVLNSLRSALDFNPPCTLGEEGWLEDDVPESFTTRTVINSGGQLEQL